MKKTKKIALVALLLASTIVLSRFLSIRTPIVTIGFSFIPRMLTAIILGPKYSIAVSGLADIIGALLFPSGAFYFGFTVSALTSGLIHGLMLFRKGAFRVDKKFVLRLVFSCILVTVLVNGVMNTIWVMATAQNAAGIIMSTRIIKQLAMLPIQIGTMLLLAKALEKQIDRLKNDRARKSEL